MKSANQVNLDVLKLLIGDELYHTVFKVMPKQTIYLSEDYDERNEEIKNASYGGVSHVELAEQYGLKPDTIRKIVNKKS